MKQGKPVASLSGLWLSALLLLGGCGKQLLPDDCQPGEHGCPCLVGERCDDGLACEFGSCVESSATDATTGDAASPGDTGSSADAAGLDAATEAAAVDASRDAAADGGDDAASSDGAADASNGGDSGQDAGSDADVGCPADEPCCGYAGGGLAPACPLADEDPEADGVQGSEETWTGSCNAAGECVVCSEAADCDDGNPCSVDSCAGGRCSYDMTTRFGEDCAVSSADDARCVTVGPALLCRLKKARACDANSQCASGFCADGVCCDEACDGECDRCDTNDVGSCELDDGLCDGNCARCGADATCEANATACTGDCGQCVEADGRFDCAADQAACGGECDVCLGSETSFGCSDEHDLCGECEECSGGACVNQPAGQDLKAECAQDECNTGACDGSGACGFEGTATKCGSGVCRRCDGAGSCVLSATHEDCGRCEMCDQSTGKCTNQPSGSDLRGDCDPVNCTSRLAGWHQSSTGHMYCRVFSAADEALDGTCRSDGSCHTYETICSGAKSQSDVYCVSEGCTKSCPVGALKTNYNTQAEVCWMDREPHACGASLACVNLGRCAVLCSAGGNECPASQECCGEDARPCEGSNGPCECFDYCW